MFPSSNGNLGGTPDSPFGGFGQGGRAGGPPPADAMFESAFEELDEDAIDALIAADDAHREASYDFLTVGLHFHEGLRAAR